jgi:hypothetical protein
MITIKNWGKLIRLFRSKLQIRESEMHYLISYYYPTLKPNQYYTITLSRMNPPQPDHEHKDEYLMLCGEAAYWLSKKELENVDFVYDAIIDVVTRHNVDTMVN